MTPHEFVTKWRTLIALPDFKEIAYYQQHLIDLCALVGHEPPASSHALGRPFAFEKSAKKDAGGTGRADAWYKGYFAIEYKGPGADLDKAYVQLKGYADELGNPPLLIVTDFNKIIIYPRFNNSINRPLTITLDDLTTSESLFRIRSMLYDPAALQTEKLAERVTTKAAERFSVLASYLAKWGNNPHDIAHFSIRLLFCLFAEDVALLPAHLFSELVANGVHDPNSFNKPIRVLFHAMAEGDYFGRDRIKYFDGGLFDSDEVLELDRDALKILADITELDWSAIEPAIFGTLFTRSLDPSQRAKLGAQYTSKDDILLVVEPVLMAPLRKEWEEVKAKARALAAQRDTAPTTARRYKLSEELRALVMGFVAKIRAIRVLDPACGSGNFLYISMRLLMDLEQDVINFCGEVGLQPFFPEVGPWQMYGIEVNEYAHELAQTTLWIGFLQWRHDNGYGFPREPILKPLDNIQLKDAILAYDAEGNPVEPEWPEADVVVGNPPFLGDRKMRRQLGHRYVDDLRRHYTGRVPAGADLVCYWFERARDQVAKRPMLRVGLLATNSIRGGANRTVLESIEKTGAIFWAVSSKDWILDDAAVDVSMVGFDGGVESAKILDGVRVDRINPDLTSSLDLTQAIRLHENNRLSFIGTQKSGPFDIPQDLAARMIATPNQSGRLNSDVVKPWINAIDVVRRPRDMWIIDFGYDTPLEQAKLYDWPYQYVEKEVKPVRDKVRRASHAQKWWLFGDTRPGFRRASSTLHRYIATPMVSKHRIFVWARVNVVPENLLVAIVRDDDYFFGVLHARPHELWGLRMGTSLEDRPRYTPTSTFETYPFPWPPGREPQDDSRVQAVAEAAAELVQLRDAWLNPPGLSEKELQKRTLTNLYNQRPPWLDAAHKKLDAAVFDAYGWPHDLSDDEILARLLELNLRRTST